MRVYFACPLEADPVFGAKMKAPRIHYLLNTIGPMRLRWHTDKNGDAVEMAVGVAEATVEQAAALEADSLMLVVRAANKDVRLRDLTAAQRNRIRTRFARLGTISNDSTIYDLFKACSRIIANRGIADIEDVDLASAKVER